jgi:hypothetical protein
MLRVNKLLAQRSSIKTHHMLRVSLRKDGCFAQRAVMSWLEAPNP